MDFFVKVWAHLGQISKPALSASPLLLWSLWAMGWLSGEAVGSMGCMACGLVGEHDVMLMRQAAV